MTMTRALRALQAIHPQEHTYKVAVYRADVDLEAYTPEGEWVGSGYLPGGKELTGYRAEMEGEDAVLRFDNVEWFGADIQAQTLLIYDATTGYAVSTTKLGRVVGVFGGLFEYQMPEEGVVRLR